MAKVYLSHITIIIRVKIFITEKFQCVLNGDLLRLNYFVISIFLRTNTLNCK